MPCRQNGRRQAFVPTNRGSIEVVVLVKKGD